MMAALKMGHPEWMVSGKELGRTAHVFYLIHPTEVQKGVKVWDERSGVNS